MYMSTYVRSYFKINKLINQLINNNSGEQEKESIIHVRVKIRPFGITVCHHLASLVMPNGDPRDGFFYPTLTLMIDSDSLNNHLNAL